MASCGVCNKELYHPVCPLCLTDKIEPWIERKKFSLVKGYREHVRNVLDKARYSKVTCAFCRGVNDKTICPSCFSGKVYNWLEVKDEKLAEEFVKTFPMQQKETKVYA